MIPEAKPTERDPVAKLGLIGGVLLALCLAVVVLSGRTKQSEFLAFAFLGGVAPPLAVVLLAMMGGLRIEAKLLAAVRMFLAVAMIGILVLGGVEFVERNPLSGILPFVAALAVSVAAAALVYFQKPSAAAARFASGVPDGLLIGLLAAIVIIFSPLEPTRKSAALVDYVLATPHFLWWLAFGLAFVGWVIWLSRLEARAASARKKWIDGLALFAFSLFLLGLFDDELYVNLEHYFVHLGPAMHAFNGGIAMVEVYCLYGLMPWVIIKAALAGIAPTFGTAAVVVRLSMLAYYLSIVVILFAIARRRLTAMILLAPMILVAVTFHPGLLNLNALPSTSGLRYLVPTLMVVVLVTVRTPAWSRWLATAILVLAAAWSIETFVYTLAPWGYVLLLQAVRTRSIREPGTVLATALGTALLAHIAFVLGTYFATGEWVDYRPYLGMLAKFQPYNTVLWAGALDPNFAVWAAVWLGLFLVLAVAGYRALLGNAPTDWASRLVPVAALGFAFMSYFAGQPTWPSLGLAFLPVAVVMIHSIEVLAARPHQYGPTGKAALFALVGVSSVLVAFGVERFARPALFDQANRTVLRRCLSAEGCQLAEVPGRLKHKVHASPLDLEGPVYQTLHDDRIATPAYRAEQASAFQSMKELVSILRDVAPRQRRVAVLGDAHSLGRANVSMAALMETGQWFRWPISSPADDTRSAEVTEFILKRVAQDAIPDGEPLIVALDRGGDHELAPLEAKILALIKRRCRLAPVETLKFHSVFRMEACSPPSRK